MRPQLSVLDLARYLGPSVQGYSLHASAAPRRYTCPRGAFPLGCGATAPGPPRSATMSRGGLGLLALPHPLLLLAPAKASSLSDAESR